ncbi:MAG: hypothetical protein JO038_03555 [Alphaproteobacteria bacterium]|nr:hypothetical protein [Alphaproteobacteria bacterium]
MSKGSEYLSRAERCERLAQHTLHPESREILLKIAALWRVRADRLPDEGHLEQAAPLDFAPVEVSAKPG